MVAFKLGMFVTPMCAPASAASIQKKTRADKDRVPSNSVSKSGPTPFKSSLGKLAWAVLVRITGKSSQLFGINDWLSDTRAALTDKHHFPTYSGVSENTANASERV